MKGKQLVTCPLSELGFLRIGTNPRALGLSMAMARRLLKGFAEYHSVEFLPADIPALESNANTSDQVTDHYLADLAARHNMKLATLDTSLKHPAAFSI